MHRIVLLDEEMNTIELKSTLSSNGMLTLKNLCPGTANNIPTNVFSVDLSLHSMFSDNMFRGK